MTGVSNSRTQKEYIMARAKERGITNLQIITADMVEFEAPEPGKYDRIVSIEARHRFNTCILHMLRFKGTVDVLTI